MTALHEKHIPFVAELMARLRDAPLGAYLFECPPISQATLATRQFEFVLIDSPELAQKSLAAPAPNPYQQHLDGHPNDSVVAFLNQDQTAILITLRQMPGRPRWSNAVWHLLGEGWRFPFLFFFYAESRLAVLSLSRHRCDRLSGPLPLRAVCDSRTPHKPSPGALETGGLVRLGVV